MTRNEITQTYFPFRRLYHTAADEISDLTKTRYGWTAVVHGKEDYEVDICMKGDVVENMDCTCPAASDGSYCAHMSAVLSAVRDAELQETDSPVSLTDIVNEMDETTLRKELCRYLNINTEQKESFCRRYGSLTGSFSMTAKFRSTLEEVTEQYSDRFGRIEPDREAAYADALTDCIYENIMPLIEKGRTMTAFRMICEAFRMINSVEMNGTNGTYGNLGSVLESMWLSVYYRCTPEEEEKMYAWFRKMYLTEKNLILSDIIESVYLNVFE